MITTKLYREFCKNGFVFKNEPEESQASVAELAAPEPYLAKASASLLSADLSKVPSLRERLASAVFGSKEKENFDMEDFEVSKFQIKDLNNIPAQFHEQIAFKLIEANLGFLVAQDLEKFQDIENYTEIALGLINTGWGHTVAENLEKFKGIDHAEIALKIIEAGKGASVAYGITKFHTDHNPITLKLIDFRPDAVAASLGKFENLHEKEIALKLIEKGYGAAVRYYLKKFTFSQEDLAEVERKLEEASEQAAK